MIDQYETITASDIAALKTRVKAEMGRRKYVGSLASYNGDFSVTAAAGNDIKIAHFNETVGYINKIAATGTTASQYGTIMDISGAVVALGSYELTPLVADPVDCASSCTGLCLTGCTSGCKTGCSSTCLNTCKASCGVECQGGCTRKCTAVCSTACSNACSASCRISCSGTCSEGCYGDCKSTCATSCSGSCEADCGASSSD